LSIENMQGMDMFTNPITGESMEEHTIERLGANGRDLAERHVMAHNLWVTNKQPAREYQFLTVLAAHPSDAPAPEISFFDTKAAAITGPDHDRKTVSFDASIRADISINVGAVRRHALQTEPEPDPVEGD
jgi:hypothetical protein